MTQNKRRRKRLLNHFQYFLFMNIPRSPSAGDAFRTALLKTGKQKNHHVANSEFNFSQNLENHWAPQLRIIFSENSLWPQTSLAKGHSGKLSWNFVIFILFFFLFCKEQNSISHHINRYVLSICNSQSQVLFQYLIFYTHAHTHNVNTAHLFIKQSSHYRNLMKENAPLVI